MQLITRQAIVSISRPGTRCGVRDEGSSDRRGGPGGGRRTRCRSHRALDGVLNALRTAFSVLAIESHILVSQVVHEFIALHAQDLAANVVVLIGIQTSGYPPEVRCAIGQVFFTVDKEVESASSMLAS